MLYELIAIVSGLASVICVVCLANIDARQVRPGSVKEVRECVSPSIVFLLLAPFRYYMRNLLALQDG